VKRIAVIVSGVYACSVLGGCGVAPREAHTSGATAASVPGFRLSARPCAIQTAGLLDLTQLPPGLEPTGPPLSELGPGALLDDATDGSVGSANQYFQGTPAVPPRQITQLAEEVTDYGTVASADRWMRGQRASNQPNDIPMNGNGVERTPRIPAMGDDALLYQIDKGARYNSNPYAGPFVGDVYTDIQVREGGVIYALSIDSGPAVNPATLAVSLVQKLMTKERAVCG
jgi:hypothetical protein